MSRRAFSTLGYALSRYRNICPSWSQTQSLLGVAPEATPDHVAWRTFKRYGGIQGVSKILQEDGYVPIREYQFPHLNVEAQHFEHVSDEDQPLVFVSELNDEGLPKEASDLIVDRIGATHLSRWDGASTGTELWGAPSYRGFKTLEQHTAYGAWVYVFGNLLNHAAFNVRNTRFYNPGDHYGEALENCVVAMADSGISINQTKGSTIHVSNDGLLHQASTSADDKEVQWSDGKRRKIPGVFVELIMRLPDSTGELKEGFEGENAARLFTSTERRRRHYD